MPGHLKDHNKQVYEVSFVEIFLSALADFVFTWPARNWIQRAILSNIIEGIKTQKYLNNDNKSTSSI